MTTRCLLVISLLVSAVAHAQLAPNQDQPVRQALPAYRWVLKVAPLSLFDPDNTVQIAAERMLGSNHAVQAEFGYGWQGLNLWNMSNSRYNDRQVWRARIEYRYYLRGSGPIGQYVAFDGFFKQINARENGAFGVGCETGPCQYYQLYANSVQKNVIGGHIKFGRQTALADGRVLFDFYVGLGLRYRFISAPDRPEGAYRYQSYGFDPFNSFYEPRPPLTASIAYGIKIGYALGR
jgi:hypothetical protein